MVTDDYDFHEKQPLFSLGQQRAIAATLNTLVFRTHLPASAQQAQQAAASPRQAGRGGGGGGGAAAPAVAGAKQQHSGMGPQYAMLADHAPVLLR